MTPDSSSAAGSLVAASREALSAGGALARGRRAATSSARCSCSMAQAVAEAIEARARWSPRPAPASARPSPTWCRRCSRGARALVSTATKSLQDQLFLRDLPRLRDALQLPVSMALLKGRGSYLCLHRLKQARQSATLPDRWAVRTLAKVGAVVARPRAAATWPSSTAWTSAAA